MITLNFGTVRGLTVEELRQLCDLADVYQYHQGRNAIKDKYYEGHVTLNDVNLGIALPRGLRNLEVGCNWGQKAVDALGIPQHVRRLCGQRYGGGHSGSTGERKPAAG